MRRYVAEQIDFGIRPNLKLNALWQLSLFVCHASENVRPYCDISWRTHILLSKLLSSSALSWQFLCTFLTPLIDTWQEITNEILLAPLPYFFPIKSINTHRDSVDFKPCQVKCNSTIQKQSPITQHLLQGPSTTSEDLQLPLFITLLYPQKIHKYLQRKWDVTARSHCLYPKLLQYANQATEKKPFSGKYFKYIYQINLPNYCWQSQKSNNCT